MYCKPKLEKIVIIWLLLLCQAYQGTADNLQSHVSFQNVEDGFPISFSLSLPVVQEPAPERWICEQFGGCNQIFMNVDSKCSQANRINITTARHTFETSGIHRFRVLGPGTVVLKVIVDTGGLKPSFLSAPQSKQMSCK